MEFAQGKTIQIYLPDGNPRSIKIAEITSRTIQAIQIPRSKLATAFSREELKNVGIYFLIGNPDDEIKQKIYIGEAEDCSVRLKQQNKSKDFWNTAIIVISKTGFFTKTHIKFLEWHCYQEALSVGRYKIDNSSVPTCPHISEPNKVDLYDNFLSIKIILSTLGYPIFDPIQKPDKKDVLICRGVGVYAEGEFSEEGFIVFSGSQAKKKETNTIGKWISNIRKKLISENILEYDEENGIYLFTQDYIFDSPSGAAGTVLGRSANGWTSWKYNDGKTLSDVNRLS